MTNQTTESESTNRIFGAAQQDQIARAVESCGLAPYVIERDLDDQLVAIDALLNSEQPDARTRYRRAINDVTFDRPLNERLAISQRLLALGSLRQSFRI